MIFKTADLVVQNVLPKFDRKSSIWKTAASFNLDLDRYLYVVVSGIEGDVFNANMDIFPWSELLPQTANGKVASVHDAYFGWPTWIGKPVYRQHNSANGVYGYIVDAYPRPHCKDVPMLLALDWEYDPHLVQKVASGEQRDVSMGALCQYVRCSYCGRKVVSGPEEFCAHLTNSRGQWIPKKMGYKHYKFAENGDYIRVGEVCYGVQGQEISIVRKGAFDSSKVLEVMTPKAAEAGEVQESRGFPDEVKLALRVLSKHILGES